MEKTAKMTRINVRSRDETKITSVLTVGLFMTSLVADCVSSPVPHPLPGQQQTKLMDRDVARIRNLREENGQIVQERLSYDHKTNAVMIQTAGNFSGDSPAILMIDFDRALVLAHVLDVDECFVFPLRNDLRDLVKTELSADEQVTVVNDQYMEYNVAGQLPNGLVESISGPTAVGMCTGRSTYWLNRKDNPSSSMRQKRSCIVILWLIFIGC